MPTETDTYKVSLVADLRTLEKNVKTAEGVVKKYQADAAKNARVKLEAGIVGLEIQLDAARKRLKKFKKDGDKSGEIKTRLEIANLKRGVRIGRAELRKLEKSATDAKKGFFNLNSITKNLFKGAFFLEAGRRIVGFFRDSAKAALEFDLAMTGVRKTVEGTEEQFKQIEAGFKTLGKTIGVPANELADIGTLAGQLGVPTEQILSFTETIAKIAASTNLTAEEAATSFAQIANVTGLPIPKIENLASVVVELGNNFATTEAAIVSMTQRIAGTADIVGFSEQQTVALAAALGSVGIPAEAGGTAVQKALLKINQAVNSGSKDLVKFGKLTGKSAEEFGEAWRDDAGALFTDFVEGLSAQGDNASNVLGELIGTDVRLQRAFLGLANAGDLLNRTMETANKEFTANNALTEEFGKFLKSDAGRVAVLEERWKALSRTIGKFINSILIPLGEFFLDTLDKIVIGTKILFETFKIGLGQLGGILKGTIRLIGASFKDIDAILQRVFNAFTRIVLKTLNFAIRQINKLAKTAQDVFRAFSLGLIDLKGQIDEVDIDALSISDANLRPFDDLKAAVSKNKQEMKNFLSTIGGGFKDIGQQIKEVQEKRINNVFDEFLEGADKIPTAAGGISKLDDTIDATKNTIEGLTEKVRLLKEEIAEEEVGSERFKELTKEILKSESALKKAIQRSEGLERPKELVKKVEEKVKDYEKRLGDAGKASEKLAKDSAKFFGEIEKSIGDVVDKQNELNAGLDEFKQEETRDFIGEAAERDIELLNEKIDLEKELKDERAEEEKDAERIKEIQKEILAITKERGEIEKFISEGGFGEQFGDVSDTLGKSEFEQNRIEFEESIKQKQEEVAEEIAKLEKIKKLNEAFRDATLEEIKSFTDADGKIQKEAFEKFLEEKGIIELTENERLEALKLASRKIGLENERIALEEELQTLEEERDRHNRLVEANFADSVDRQKSKFQELIEKVKEAQREVLRLQALQGASTSSAARNADQAVQNFAITQNINGDIDGTAAIQDLARQIR